MRVQHALWRIPGLRNATVLALALVTSPANAHVKWFAPFDTQTRPLSTTAVADERFIVFSLVLPAILFLGYVLDRQIDRSQWMLALDRHLGPTRDRLPDILRFAVAIFFGALWATGGIILTPELKTTSPLIPWLQFFIALSTMFRHTLFFTGIGILGLYGYAINEYGIFHLFDYPIFIGIAIYLMLTGTGRPRFIEWRMPVLFASVGTTLMWAAIEKFCYPQWTFPILTQKPEITLGIDHATYMCYAGFVEFTLAFFLISSTAFIRLAGAVLLLMFTAAIFEFGKIDALGHLLIIVVLAMFVIHGKTPLHVVVDRLGGSAIVHSGALVALHFGALALFLHLYQFLHHVAA
jgi:hypothetical protein